tara:strand:+ start:60 stop:314 length:255 start_codon:yes stop_codon:yes gene_type:complete
MTNRLYRIICLKRSEFAARDEYEYLSDWLKACNLVYWRPDRRGYTSAPEGAGLYTSADLDDCAGNTGDWIVEPVNSVQVTLGEF